MLPIAPHITSGPVQPNLYDALREIHRLLRKGGNFCFAEPHQKTVFSKVRLLV